MKQGYRIIDTDTHVGPNLETLAEYAGPALRERWHELDQYWMPVTDGGHHLSISPFPYKRRLRQSTVLEADGVAGWPAVAAEGCRDGGARDPAQPRRQQPQRRRAARRHGS